MHLKKEKGKKKNHLLFHKIQIVCKESDLTKQLKGMTAFKCHREKKIEKKRKGKGMISFPFEHLSPQGPDWIIWPHLHEST